MRYIVCLIMVLAAANTVVGAEGVTSVKSAHSVAETADRLESVLKEKGMTVFVRIDHAAGARSVGESLRPTQLVIFGNPKVGTPLMTCRQTIALDLPQKALIWEDEEGSVWLSYNEPAYLAHRHDLEGCRDVLAKVAKALSSFATAATAP
jgi:uncharacterized protein (DUF302 family)